MGNYIEEAHVTVLGNTLDETFHFHQGLNILAGENGTLKTKILAQIKANAAQIKPHVPGTALRVEAISPKRNHDLRTTDQILASLRQNNRTMDKLITELSNLKIDDKVFPRYPSSGELFYIVFEDVCREGGNRKEAMEMVVRDFNAVISRVFASYRLEATWDNEKGTPLLEIVKGSDISFPLEGLSLGESEVLAVALNLYASRESYDVYLIDEPENHLNWHLESMLFAFFNWFCETFDKQLIVATHSRAVFQSELLERTQFLEWTSDGKITALRSPTDLIRERLAGEAISVIRLGEFPRTTFFVEDHAHERTLAALGQSVGVDIDITRCGGADVVKVMYQYSLREGGWANTFFLVDGDNQGNPYPNSPEFICLDAYCIENYLIDPAIVAALGGITLEETRANLLSSINARRSKILRNYKWLGFLLDRLNAEDLTAAVLARIDGSELLPGLLDKLRISQNQYIDKYVQKCAELDKLEAIFPEALLGAIQAASPGIEGHIP